MSDAQWEGIGICRRSEPRRFQVPRVPITGTLRSAPTVGNAGTGRRARGHGASPARRGGSGTTGHVIRFVGQWGWYGGERCRWAGLGRREPAGRRRATDTGEVGVLGTEVVVVGVAWLRSAVMRPN
jgi:hypothetical protein